MLRYYVYFDAYGHPRRAVNAAQLAAEYADDPEVFRRSACNAPQGAGPQFVSGHVGVLAFGDEAELGRYLESLGEEIAGFYDGIGDSRPYNF
jgi:hypothetical protein